MGSYSWSGTKGPAKNGRLFLVDRKGRSSYSDSSSPWGSLVSSSDEESKKSGS